MEGSIDFECILCLHCIDSCLVKNGGCDKNADCSHDSKTNAVICTCKTGYTNTGSDSNVICTGTVLFREAHWRKERQSTIKCILHTLSVLDSCQVKNGGCDCNAICSHEPTTNAVKCTCKTGYTNTGSGSSVNCTGMFIIYSTSYNRRRSQHESLSLSDTCLINNGGCDPNAACTHHPKTYEVVCICNQGYKNTGTAPTVVCTGMYMRLHYYSLYTYFDICLFLLTRHLWSEQRWLW